MPVSVRTHRRTRLGRHSWINWSLRGWPSITWQPWGWLSLNTRSTATLTARRLASVRLAAAQRRNTPRRRRRR